MTDFQVLCQRLLCALRTRHQAYEDAWIADFACLWEPTPDTIATRNIARGRVCSAETAVTTLRKDIAVYRQLHNID